MSRNAGSKGESEPVIPATHEACSPWSEARWVGHGFHNVLTMGRRGAGGSLVMNRYKCAYSHPKAAWSNLLAAARGHAPPDNSRAGVGTVLSEHCA
jgi:hypothetical protein